MSKKGLSLIPDYGSSDAALPRGTSAGRISRMWLSSKANPAAPSAEDYFRLIQQNFEVRQFAETGAISNDVPVAAESKALDNMEGAKRTEVSQAKKAPPTPSEIVEDTKGGPEFSTLSRFLVQTDQDVVGIPSGRPREQWHPKPEKLDSKMERLNPKRSSPNPLNELISDLGESLSKDSVKRSGESLLVRGSDEDELRGVLDLALKSFSKKFPEAYLELKVTDVRELPNGETQIKVSPILNPGMKLSRGTDYEIWSDVVEISFEGDRSRPAVVVDYNMKRMAFYKSTGTGGQTDMGDWVPFYGIADLNGESVPWIHHSWFVKGEASKIPAPGTDEYEARKQLLALDHAGELQPLRKIEIPSHNFRQRASIQNIKDAYEACKEVNGWLSYHGALRGNEKFARGNPLIGWSHSSKWKSWNPDMTSFLKILIKKAGLNYSSVMNMSVQDLAAVSGLSVPEALVLWRSQN